MNWDHKREDGTEVTIQWEVGESIDYHGSGCRDVQLTGYDEHDNKYEASGNTQDGELVEVYDDIEELPTTITT